MSDAIGSLYRTHTCGELRATDVGRDVVLLGWVHRVRDLGALLFFDIRDRAGITQVVVRDDETVRATAKRLRPEYVVAVRGRVAERTPDTVNPKIDTGEIEVVAREIRLLNEARTPPFSIADETPVSEETRLRYRYLDLRRPRMQHHLGLRHAVTMAIRRYLDAQGFWEIETPILTKSTPEGARDFLVPSRLHPGKFYALPQSPQLFKQLLMIAGVDRYFQIARCFRDEDLRADRQLEFTQVDLEMAFATPDLIFDLIEGLMQVVMEVAGRTVSRPFRRIPYAEAVARYGTDKPDLRCDLAIEDLSALFAGSPFGPFREALARGGVVRGLLIPGGAQLARRELDELVEQARALGAPGLVWVRRGADGTLQSPAKAAGEPVLARALEQTRAAGDDLLVLAAGPGIEISKCLGQLRLAWARRLGLLKPDAFAFAWIVDFPLLEWNEDEQRWDAVQHPFTAPVDADVPRLETEPASVRGRIYDLILNGWEIGGGSIRIHDQQLQRRIFRLLNLRDEEAEARFGFFLEALEYGTPPHGGIALGLDRIVAILAGETSIREVIAFPKTAAAVDLMAGAPSPVDERQLRELHIRLVT